MMNARPHHSPNLKPGYTGGYANFSRRNNYRPEIHHGVVYSLTEYSLSNTCAFVILNESDTILIVQSEIFMVLKNGEIRVFQGSKGNFGPLQPIHLAMLVNALRQWAGSVPLRVALVLAILLFSVEKASAQIVNGNFSSGGTGWTSTIPTGSSLSYTGNQLTTVSDNDGGANSRTYAAQSLTNSDPGFLTWLLRSYTSVDSDLGVYDYPMVLVGTTFSYVNTAGGIQATNTGAAVDNDNTGIANLTVRTTLATAGTRNIGAGVTSTDSCCGAGTAIWDDIVFQEFTQSPGAQTTPFNTPLNLSGANALAIATNSGVASPSVTLTVPTGTLTLGSTTGLTFTSGANGTTTMTFNGSVANINAALNTLTFTPTTGYNGTFNLSFTANFGGANVDTDTISITVSPPTFSFTIAKTTPTATVSAAGTVITYTVTVTNTGTGSFTGTTITDNVVQGVSSTALTVGSPTGDGGVTGTMEAGEVWVYTITHTVTQAQMDNAGDLVNTATFDTAQTSTQSASATTTVTASPSLSLAKSSSAPGFTTDNILEAPAGTVVTYTYTVTNTGNQTISNIDIDDSGHTGLGPWTDPVHVGLVDNLPTGGSTDSNPSNNIWGALGPNDVVTFSTTYTISQADIDAQ